MIINRGLRENLFIMITFFIAAIAMILPVPVWAMYVKPQWVFVVLLFWLMYVPRKIGPLTAWCVGLYVDLLMGNVLGEHALIFVLVTYVVQKFLRLFQAMPLWQQMLCVGLFTFIVMCLEWVFLRQLNFSVMHWQMLLPVLANMIVWPWLYFLCRDVRPKHDYRLLHSR